MELITNIDVVKIPIVEGQYTYYLPYSKKDIVPQRILLAPKVDDLQGWESYLGNLFLTLTDADGEFICKDYCMNYSSLSMSYHGTLEINRRIDPTTSYIRIPYDTDTTLGQCIFLYVVYAIEAAAVQHNKIESIVINSGESEQRLSDYFTGFRGSLLRIEVCDYSGGKQSARGYIILNDSTGRSINAPLSMFADTTAVRQARILNPYLFMPIQPIWQNSRIYTPTDVKLNFFFA